MLARGMPRRLPRGTLGHRHCVEIVDILKNKHLERFKEIENLPYLRNEKTKLQVFALNVVRPIVASKIMSSPK